MREFKRASRRILGDDIAFAKGTQIEERAILSQQKQQDVDIEKLRQERKENYLKLEYLYDVLNIKPLNSKYDILKIISKTKLCSVFLEHENEIKNDKMLTYIFASKFIIPLIGTDEYSKLYTYIMNRLSIILFKDKNYWLEDNNIDINYLYKEKKNDNS